MDSENIVCPVCTLFLRPGITLKAHLSSHPKQKVIEALVRISSGENDSKLQPSTSTQNESVPATTSNNNAWNSSSIPVNTVYPNFGTMPGNHSFIYQQFMSSSAPPPNVMNVNPLTQQIVTIPTVFNPQMMCPPYVYQQQQVIMSSGPSVMSIVQKPLPIELPTSPNHDRSSPTSLEADDQDDLTDEPELISVEISELGKNDELELAGKTNQENIVLEIEKSETEITPDIKGTSDYKVEETKATDQSDTIEDEEERCNVKITDCNAMGEELPSAMQDYSMKNTVDLNKSCQTQTVNNYGDVPLNEDEEIIQIPNGVDNKPSCYYTEVQDNITNTNYTILQNSYDQGESTYTSTHTESLFATRSQEQNTNVIDMDGMNLFITSDFLNGHLVSQVEEFDCNTDRPRIILNLGDLDTNFADREGNEESLSRESAANIRTDEHMPPRGELSGQESNGATSDVNWNRMQYQEVCTSYDLIAREHWNDDISDTEPTTVQNPTQTSINDDDTPTVSGFREPPITYKCPTCGDSFNCPKERRVHQREHHRITEKKDKETASQIGGKRVKKLTIKPKRSEIKTENNFDNVFTNRLKLESSAENEKCDVTQQNGEVVVQKKEDPVAVSNPNVCTICNTVVADNNALKRHQQHAHNLSPEIKYKCKICEQIFPNEYKYTEHLKTHPLECRLCGKYFYRKQNMQLHMKRHLGIKPYKCNICEKAFLTKQKHDEHKNIHTGNTPIKCNMCDETFRRHSNLVQHRNRHHLNMKRKMKDYICFCGEVFHSKRKLAWHKEIHDPKPKACSHCSEKFIHMSSLTRHIRRAHNERFLPNEERVSENVECPICKGVYLRSYLEVHVRNHSGHKPFTCLVCNKSFTTKWNLKLHKWTHASRTSKPFKCDQCKGAFIRESDYTAHMNAHKSVKPYTCNYCGAQFIRKYNCQRHVKEHEKVKTFSCQVCGKSFHRSYYLKDHMRVHSGVRPYTCHVCGKTSTTKSNHNKHVRIHHAREPVTHLPALVKDDVADTSTSGDHMKIAFRYTNLPTNEPRIKHEFGHYYDLSTTMTSEIMEGVDIHYWQNKDDVKCKNQCFKNRSYQDLLENIKSVLGNSQYSYSDTTDKRNILKIGIYGIGSPLWMSNNDCDSRSDLNKFFICLRALLKSSLAVAVVTVPSHLYDKEVLNRCVNASDVSLRLQALAGTELEHNKYLADYHGYFHIDKLAAINTFVSKHPGPIEYMFKLRRKKFTIEMLHLPPDLEVSEDKKAVPSLGCASNTRHLLEF